MKRYVQVSLKDVVERQLPEWESWDGGYEDDLYWGAAIYRCDDEGNPVEFIACDGGEPEDNSFNRDGGWIVGELNRAAEQG